MSVVSFKTKCEKARAGSELKSAASSSIASMVDAQNEQDKERKSDAKALRSNMSGKHKFEKYSSGGSERQPRKLMISDQ
jgi:hypothetical protein